MELVLIAAVAKNRVIGNKGQIPWHIPEDLRRFKALTLNHPVIMGRVTYEDILKRLKRPLPSRQNIVLTSCPRPDRGIYVAHSIDEAVNIAESFSNQAYVIGGAKVYEAAVDLASRMELTEIDKEYEGDAFFPDFPKDDWDEKPGDKRELNGLNYVFVTYQRRLK
jgi:dihydrofolate reductase